MHKPDVKPGDRIVIARDAALGKTKWAVVSRLYPDSNQVEAVYLQSKTKPIAEDFVWKDGKWEFKVEGPNGLYADKTPRLREFVSILRSIERF